MPLPPLLSTGLYLIGTTLLLPGTVLLLPVVEVADAVDSNGQKNVRPASEWDVLCIAL
jgi:hypothetical protein